MCACKMLPVHAVADTPLVGLGPAIGRRVWGCVVRPAAQHVAGAHGRAARHCYPAMSAALSRAPSQPDRHSALHAVPHL